jgi:hypothetical protein
VHLRWLKVLVAPLASLAGVGLSVALSTWMNDAPSSGGVSQAVLHPHAPGWATRTSHALHFEQNLGQTLAEADYLARGAGYALLLAPSGAHFVTQTGRDSSAHWLSLAFKGGNRSAAVLPLETVNVPVTYLKDGARARPQRAHMASRVRYSDVYPGIDVEYYGREGVLEFDFKLAPGADPAWIRLDVKGADDITLDNSGNLLLDTQHGQFVHYAPVSYQTTKTGSRQSVASRFVVDAGEIHVAVAEYDKTRELVIDPIVQFSTYAGGALDDDALAVATTEDGQVYVAGATTSVDFFGIGQGAKGGMDIFLNHYAANGDLLAAAYVGGQGHDEVRDIDLDHAGNVILVGRTTSLDFPTFSPSQLPYQASSGGGQDGFIIKRSAKNNWVFSSYLGGADDDDISRVDTGGGGIFVAGIIGALSINETPLQNHVMDYSGGATDGFVAQLDASGEFMHWSAYVGGSGIETDTQVAVDNVGNVFIAGTTLSTDLPTTVNSIQQVMNGVGKQEVYYGRFMQNGGLVFLSYLGGNGHDQAHGLRVTSSGELVLGGDTQSPDFPLAHAPVGNVLAGGWDMFIARVASDGKSLSYGRYVGGSQNDRLFKLALDANDNAYFGGSSDSPEWPVLGNGYPATVLQGTRDGVIGVLEGDTVRIQADGVDLMVAGYWGGSDSDAIHAIDVTPYGDLAFVGATSSGDLLATGSAAQPSAFGAEEGFVGKLTTGVDMSVSAIASAEPVVLGNALYYDVTIHNGSTQTAEKTTLNLEFPPSWYVNVAPNYSCVGGVAPVALVCVLPPINAGDDLTVNVHLLPDATGAYGFNAEVITQEPDLAKNNDKSHLLGNVVTPSTSGMVLWQSTARVGDGVQWYVVDTSYDLDSLSPDTHVSVVSNTVTGEQESLALVETGGNTGIFSANLPTHYEASVGTSHNGSLGVAAGQLIELRYTSIQSGTDVVGVLSMSGGNTAFFTSPMEHVVGNMLELNLTEPDLAAANVNDVVSVNIVSSGGDVESVILHETTRDSKILRATLPTQYAAGASVMNDGVLSILPGDNIDVNYQDMKSFEGGSQNVSTTLAVVGGQDAQITVLSDDPDAGEDVVVQITSADGEHDPEAPDTLSLNVSNVATGEAETIVASETASNSGVYVAHLATDLANGAGALEDGRLNVQSGDEITFSYVDPILASGATGVVSVQVTLGDGMPLNLSSEISLQTDEDVSLSGALAHHLPHDQVSYTITSHPAQGHLVLEDASTGTYVYAPQRNSYGSIPFVYQVVATNGDTETIVATIEVNPVNDPPEVAMGQNTGAPYGAQIRAGHTYRGRLMAHDEDGDVITYALVSQSTPNVTISLNPATGWFTFTPDQGFQGNAHFNYIATDGVDDSSMGTWVFAVKPLVDEVSISKDEAESQISARQEGGGSLDTYWASLLFIGVWLRFYQGKGRRLCVH